MKSLPLSLIPAGIVALALLCAQRLDSGQRASDDEKVRMEITAVLDAQRADWNRGDVDSFMESYWLHPK